MRVLGEICLLLSLVSIGYAAIVSVLWAEDAHPWRQRVGVSAAAIGFLSLSITTLILGIALATRDYDFAYVAQYASRLLPWKYCLSALWVGQAGSLLLWAWMTAAMAIGLRILPASDAQRQRPARLAAQSGRT